MRSFLTWCSKYVSISAILIIGFIVYILFIQDYSVTTIYHNEVEAEKLEKEIAAGRDSINYYHEKNELLDNHDRDIVERIVREQFDMSLPTEEVYVFK